MVRTTRFLVIYEEITNKIMIPRIYIKRMSFLITITKEEKERLVKLFPNCKFPRTMKQDSKRHHYFCTESEDLMRAIADSNTAAAECVKEFDRQRALRNARKKNLRGDR